MLNTVWERLMSIDKMGIFLMLLAGIMVYGARFMATNIFKFPTSKSTRSIIMIKLVGLLAGIVGFWRITQKI